MNTEMKIKQLENQIARLKSESALQNRINHICKAYEQKTRTQNDEIDELTHRYADLKMEIDEYCGRISNIFTLLSELKEHNFNITNRYIPLNDKIRFNIEKGNYLTVTNTLWHPCRWVSVEFYYNDVDEPDLTVESGFYEATHRYKDHKDKVSRMEACLYAMQNFINDFNDFEKYVFDFVDSL